MIFLIVSLSNLADILQPKKNRVSRLLADLWEDALSTNKTVHGKMHELIGTGVRGNCIIFISRLITKQVLQLVLFFLSSSGAIKKMI